MRTVGSRRLPALVIAAGLAAATGAQGACTVPGPICSAAPLLASATCCGATNCLIDSTVTLTGPSCTLDFQGRNVTVTGKLVVGGGALVIRAATFTLKGTIDAAGTGEAAGGDVTLDVDAFAMGPNVGGAAITATGPSGGGGSISVFATTTIDLLTGSLQAEGVNGAAPAGTILLDAGSDVVVNVNLRANGGSPPPGFVDSVRVRADGDVRLGPTGKLLARRGTASIDAGGALLIEASTTPAIDAPEGAILVEAASVDVRSTLKAVPGSSIDVLARSGPIRLEKTAPIIETSGTPSITLVTDAPAPDGSVTINGPITAPTGFIEIDAQGSVTIGKPIDVTGTLEDGPGAVEITSFGDVTVAGKITGTSPDTGASLDITAERDVLIANNVILTGQTDGFGGDLVIEAQRDVRFAGAFTVNAMGSDTADGGSLDVRAGRDLVVEPAFTLRTNGGGLGGASGDISLAAGADVIQGLYAGDLTVHGKILANGGSAAAVRVTLEGCDVTISASGVVDATGDQLAATDVTGRTGIVVAGQLKAQEANVLTFSAATTPILTGTVSPAPSAGGACGALNGTPVALGCERAVCTGPGYDQPAGCLHPCPTCGDGAIQYPETCDPGGQDRCVSGCDFHCQDSACPPSTPCLASSCDVLGGCYATTVPNGTPCGLSGACGQCRLSQCIAGMACEDYNPCTRDCDADGVCLPEPVPTDGADVPGCDDGNPCTGVETCASGVCQPGTAVTCPPGTPPEVCDPTDGTCAPQGCVAAAECDDQNPCTDDVCTPEGFCTNPPRTNGVPCGDTDVCDGTRTCQGGLCTGGTPLDCDDGCAATVDTCDPALGCQHIGDADACCAGNAECDDGNPCTNDLCGLDGLCTNVPSDTCCTADSDCDDANPCTDDSLCIAGQCTHAPRPDGPVAGCGDACAPATCLAGTCQSGEPTRCDDDGDPCTNDFCDPGIGCVHDPIPDCCVVASDARCDDGNVCTVDRCDAEIERCLHEVVDETCTVCDAADPFACDPAGACAATRCLGGRCTPVSAPVCEDANPCTADGCDPLTGCINTALEGPVTGCGDGLVCNGDERCEAGTCGSGTAPRCDDGDLCTDDDCAEPAGCVHTARSGYASVRCEIDGIDGCLGIGEVPAKQAAKLGTLLGQARSRLDAAEAAGSGKKARKGLKKTDAKVKAVAKYARKQRKKLPGEVVDCTARTTGETLAASATLRDTL